MTGHPFAKGELEAKVDAFIEPYIETRDFSGAVLIASEGEALLKRAYGMANYELGVPNTPQTKFHIASITKTFTAAAIMMLQERGLLCVKDHVSKVVADYPNGESITLHHLLSHTSGIPDYGDFPDYTERMLKHLSVEETVAWFKDKPLQFKPGEQYSYSNCNYVLLAHIIEIVSGKSYEEFMQENFFRPLAMNDTGNFSHEDLVENRANRYSPGPNGLINAPWYDKSFKTGSGSLYSTVEDLYKWDCALYTERLLKKSSIERLFTPNKGNWGYGWFVDSLFNRRTMRMGGSSPGAMAHIARFVEDDACVIYVSNVRSGAGFTLHKDLSAILFGEDYRTPVFKKQVELDSEVIDAYVGIYQHPRFAFSIVKKGDHLWGGQGAVLGYNLFYLMPVSETEFFNREGYYTVTFVKDDRGKASHMLLDAPELWGPEKVRCPKIR